MARTPMSRKMATGVCMEKKTRAQVRCETQAASLDEMKACVTSN